MEADISTWRKPGHFYFALTAAHGFEKIDKHVHLAAFKNLPERDIASFKARHIGTILIGTEDKIYPHVLRIALTIDRKTKRQETEVLQNLFDAIAV